MSSAKTNKAPRGIVQFTEQRNQVLLHDFLVYVCGVDVSKYVKSLSITYSDRNSPSSCDIVLTNPNGQWVLTRRNFYNEWNISNSPYSETEKRNIYNKKKRLSARSPRVAKSSIPDNKKPTGVVQKEEGEGDTQETKVNVTPQDDVNQFLERYGFGPGALVFSRFDTVKVFIKNPFSSTASDEWFPAFTGTVENKSLTTDFVSGSSMVSLQAYDIRKIMEAMRVSINPITSEQFQRSQNAAAGNATLTPEDIGIFGDIYFDSRRGSSFDNVFANKSFVDSVSMLLTGRTGWVTGSVETDDGFGARMGYFKPGKVYRYAHPSNKDSVQKPDSGKLVTNLEEWDNLCLFGTRKGLGAPVPATDRKANVAKQQTSATGETIATDSIATPDSAGTSVQYEQVQPTQFPFANKFLTLAECRRKGENSFWDVAIGDGNRGNACTPMDGEVHWLVPAEGLNITNTIVQSVSGLNNVTGSPDWVDRYSLLLQFLRAVDYQCTVTGDGDFVLEFPQYDFFPSNYGANASIYEFSRHVGSENIQDESGDIITALEVQGRYTPLGEAQVADAVLQERLRQELTELRTVVTSPVMATRYGVRVANVTITGIANTGNLDQARTVLKKFAVLEFQKRLAEVNKLSFTTTYRPFIRPNRPVLHKTRERLGLVGSVRLDLSVFQAAQMSLSLYCVRVPLYERKGNVFVINYQHITGGYAMALSYNEIFDTRTDAISSNGITTTDNPQPEKQDAR